MVGFSADERRAHLVSGVEGIKTLVCAGVFQDGVITWKTSDDNHAQRVRQALDAGTDVSVARDSVVRVISHQSN